MHFQQTNINLFRLESPQQGSNVYTMAPNLMASLAFKFSCSVLLYPFKPYLNTSNLACLSETTSLSSESYSVEHIVILKVINNKNSVLV